MRHMRTVRFLALTILTIGLCLAGNSWDNVGKLSPGAHILVTSGFTTEVGRFVSATADAMVFDSPAGQMTMAKKEIDAVYVPGNGKLQVKKALLTGGLAAAGIASFMFPMAARVSNPNYVLPSITTATTGVSFGMIGIRPAPAKRIYRRN